MDGRVNLSFCVMEKYNFKKKYGQNFLSNISILLNISKYANIKEDDLVIEIGPGSGNLTKELQKYNSNLLCFEIDKDLNKYLSKLENQKTKIIYEDFLKIDISSIISNYKYNNLYIIGNLPYYITTAIIEKILNSNVLPNKMIFMVQKEVADRFIASPKSKNYGSFTVFINLKYSVKKLLDVNKKEFIPVPKVDSSVVLFERKENFYELNDKKTFYTLVRESFKFKRKNIRNNLKNYDLDLIEEILKKYNLTLQSRAEEMPIECFVELSNKLC